MGTQQTPSTAVEVFNKTDFQAQLARFTPQLKEVCYRSFTPERVIVAATDAAIKEPKIFKATASSLYLALSRVARWGLDIGDTVHLVPLTVNIAKRNEPARFIQIVEAWPDYKGLKALAMRDGIVRGMEEFVVYTGDTFTYQLGLDATLRHVPTGDATKRGAMRGAYTIVRLPYGEKTFNYLPIEDIEAIRVKSKSWGPDKVKICPAWYAKKTAVRDYLNRQPKAGALREALAADDTEEQDTAYFDRSKGPALAVPSTTDDDHEDREYDAALVAEERGA